jgi:alpha-L-rhamnosidase
VDRGETTWFEAGLLERSDWRAKWIGATFSGGPRTTFPPPLLRQEVSLEAGVKKARLYVSALGLYEFRINGQRVGEDLLAPGWTDYRKRVRYQTYDVTSLLREGENALGAMLGDGWYCGNLEWRGRELYGDRPWLLAQLEVDLDDWSTVTIWSDESWKFTLGPVLEADLLMGEGYDARKELPGWDKAGFDDSHWIGVQTSEHSMDLVAPVGPMVRVTEEIKPVGPPVEMPRWPRPDYIFDLGQNMVGVVRLKVKGDAGATVRLRFGEVLDSNGRLYTENLRGAKQTDYYTLRGDPNGEEWTSQFTFHGFRYVEVYDYPGPISEDAITGIVFHSDTPRTGEFECSDPLVNKLQANIDWGWRGNSVDIPTDCPQRDERLGWTGDAQVFVRTACFNRDVSGFFAEWQDTLRESQSEKGEFPCTAPNTGVVNQDGGPAWADAGVICPWTVYRCYGDTGILERHYDSVKAFLGYMERTHKDFIRSYEGYEGFRGFGDWLSIEAYTPEDLIGTAFFAYCTGLGAKMASVLGKSEDAEKFRALSETVKKAFQKKYVAEDGKLTPPTQTAYLLALQFDLMPEGLREAAAKELVADIEAREGHLSAGFVGSSYANHVLCEGGRNDVAFRLLGQKSWPSWLYPVTQGATTIWERWDGWTEEKGFQDPGMNSFNHYAYGAIGAWLYQRVAGIELDPEVPGYKRFILRPTPGEGLDWAKGSLLTGYGLIESSWKVSGGVFDWTARVPANTSARAYLPPGKVLESGGVQVSDGVYDLEPGRYRFRVQ